MLVYYFCVHSKQKESDPTVKKASVEAVIETYIAMKAIAPFAADQLRGIFSEYYVNPGQFQSAEDVLIRVDRIFKNEVLDEVISVRGQTQQSAIYVALPKREYSQGLISDLEKAIRACHTHLGIVLRRHGIEDSSYPMVSARLSKPFIRDNRKSRKRFDKLMSGVPDNAIPPDSEIRP